MITSGLFIGLMVFGVGFSDSAAIKEGYTLLVWLWKILNAPASFFISGNSIVYLIVQLITSFLWANIYALLWSKYKA